MRIKLLLSLVGGVIVVLAGGYVYFQHDEMAADVVYPMSISSAVCATTREACIARHENFGQLSLRFPEPAIYMSPFVAAVEIESGADATINSVVLDLQMQGMNMGVNRFSLQPEATRPGRWSGKLLLPLCVSGRSDWLVNVEVGTATGQYQVQFPLQVGKSTR